MEPSDVAPPHMVTALHAFETDPHVLHLHTLLHAAPTFNLFEAFGMVRQELRHSDMLAFLLNPRATHGLGLHCARLLLATMMPHGTAAALHLDPLDVRRKWENIDVLVVSPSDRLVILLENKIDSPEHTNQLQRYATRVADRYPGWQHLAVYLTPSGDPPLKQADREHYITLSYRTILRIVEDLLLHAQNDVAILLRHYRDILRNHIVTDNDNDTAQHFRRAYREHQPVIDQMIRYRDQRLRMIAQSANRLLLETESNQPELLKMDDPGSNQNPLIWYVRFAPTAWYRPELLIGDRWTKSGLVLLFQIQFSLDAVLIDLTVGPEKQSTGVRDRLFALAQQHAGPLRPTWSDPSNDWFTIYGRTILGPDTAYFSTLSDSAIKQALRAGFEAFLAEDLPLIRVSIQEAVPPT